MTGNSLGSFYIANMFEWYISSKNCFGKFKCNMCAWNTTSDIVFFYVPSTNSIFLALSLTWLQSFLGALFPGENSSEIQRKTEREKVGERERESKRNTFHTHIKINRKFSHGSSHQSSTWSFLDLIHFFRFSVRFPSFYSYCGLAHFLVIFGANRMLPMHLLRKILRCKCLFLIIPHIKSSGKIVWSPSIQCVCVCAKENFLFVGQRRKLK